MGKMGGTDKIGLGGAGAGYCRCMCINRFQSIMIGRICCKRVVEYAIIATIFMLLRQKQDKYKIKRAVVKFLFREFIGHLK